MSDLLRADDLHKSYHDGQRELSVLRGASLAVGRGESVAVVGASGSGKSTLLRLLGGLDRPDKGEIYFEGQPITGQPLARIEADTERDLFMDAETAKKYGLVDEVLYSDDMVRPKED